MICWGPNSLASHNKFRCQMNSEHHLWRCMHCDRSFKTQSSLHFHKNIHKGLKPFPCKICGKVFAYPASRRRHYDQHFQRESVSCTKCQKVFVDKNSLYTHIRKFHKSQDEYKCQHCGQCFKSGVGLSNHIRIHKRTNAQNFCTICKLNYTYSFNFARHMRRRHPQVKILRCGKCRKVCADKSRLALHVAIKHSKKQGNESHHRGSSSDSHLKQRSRQHGKENKNLQQSKKGVSVLDSLKCKKCKRGLPRNKFCNHMCIHQNTDINKVAGQEVSKKPVKSSGQERGNYSSLPKDSFERHNSTVRCEFCFKGFRSWDLMCRHRAAHFRKLNPALPAITNAEQQVANKKPANTLRQKRANSPSLPKNRFVGQNSAVKCEFCFKAFPNSDLMHCQRASHFRKTNPALPIPGRIQSTVPQKESPDNTEHSRKKIRCQTYSKKFPSLQKLHSHRAIHFSDIEIFCCDICGKSFQTKTSLASHKSHHSLLRRARESGDVSSTSLPRHSQETTDSQAAEKKFLSLSNLHCHRAVHFKKGIGRFCCNVCGKSFRTKMSLGAHKTHHSLKRRARGSSDSHRTVHFRKGIGHFFCKVCGKSFTTERSLRSHKSHHSRGHGSSDTLLNPSPKHSQENAEPQAVNECSRNDVCSGEIEENKSLQSNGDHSVGQNTRKKHLMKGHSSSTSSSENAFSTRECKLFRCDVCGKTFSVKTALQKHRGHHTRAKQFHTHHFKSRAVVRGNVPKPYECSNCLESFSTRRALSVHKSLSHDGINATFICPFCDKTFSSREDLLLHKQTLHSTADPFLCLHCNAQFTSKYSRNNHSCRVEKKEASVKPEARVEPNQTVDESHQAPHVCGICLASFPSFRSLSCHKRSHAGTSAPYVCSICHRGFSTKFSLLRHKRNQHSTTSLLCENEPALKGNRSDHSSISQITTCDKTASEVSEAFLTASESTLKNSSPPKTHHSMRNAAGISQFGCLPCNKRFVTYSGLYKHKFKHHSEKKTDCAYTEKTNLDQGQQGCKPDSTDTAISQYSCFPCDKQFLSKSDFYSHELQHHAKSKADAAQNEQTSVNVKQGVKLVGQDDVSYRKCHYCEKVFQSDGGLRKHIRKKHREGKSLNEEKKARNSSSFKCPYCEKEFMSLSGRKKHVWTKHPKCNKKKVDGQQARRPQMKTNIEARGSETTKAKLTCHHCKMSFLTSGSQNSRLSCSRCNTELSTQSGISWDSRSSMVSGMNTIRAFRCQYCLKGFSTLNSRYKHIMIVHGTDLICITHALCETSGSSHNNTINPESLTGQQLSSKTVQNCDKVYGSASDDNHQLRGTKSKTVKKLIRMRKCENGNIDKGKRSGNTASLRKEPLLARQVPFASPSTDSSHSRKVSGSTLQPTDKAFPCQYCPRQFVSVSGRYKHVALAHLGKASTSSKVCQSYNTIPFESSESLVSPAKRARLSSNSSGQPQEARTVESDIISSCSGVVSFSSKQTLSRFKAFQCAYCTRSFSACSLRYKHYLLVHFGSPALAKHGFVALEVRSTNNPSQTSLPHTTSNDSLARVKPMRSNFVSQSKIPEQIPTSFPDTCRICSKFFLTRDDWVTHFKQEHNKAGKAMCGIRSPPRPALRTISAAFHNNSFRPLRNRRVTRTKVKNGKQVSSLRGRNVAKPKSSVCLPTKPNIRDKRFQCDVCLLFFSSKECVTRHKKTKHCIDRPFQCNDCGFATKRGDYISIHKRFHCKGSI